MLIVMGIVLESGAILLQAKLPVILDTSLFHTAIAVYLAAIALDEIDFRDLLGRIAENRFQRIAMSLGDGLVCTDRNHLITVWNPGAKAIFGYEADAMIGRPFDVLCAGGARGTPFPIRDGATPAAIACCRPCRKDWRSKPGRKAWWRASVVTSSPLPFPVRRFRRRPRNLPSASRGLSIGRSPRERASIASRSASALRSTREAA